MDGRVTLAVHFVAVIVFVPRRRFVDHQQCIGIEIDGLAHRVTQLP
jgi:hypothetical protein